MDRIVFAWDCDAGVLGHLVYGARKLAGRSCALCDLSYTGLRPSDAFEACKASMPIPIVALYRDELSAELAALIDGAFPCVVLERGGARSVLLGPEDLARLEGFADLEVILREAVGEGQVAVGRESQGG